MISDVADSVAPRGEYLSSLPIGEDISPRTDFFAWDAFPFEKDEEGRVRIRRLDPPVLPEPPRGGEDGPADCDICAKPDEAYLWTDEHWRVAYPHKPGGGAAVVFLEPRAHVDLHELPEDLAAELGPMILRVERALASLDDVGRVHMHRWGDGIAHMHLWFVVRPAGMLQLRGSFLPAWNGLLPAVPEDYFRGVNVKLAAALAKGGGQAHLH
jgi:diadenosine tetraphosphate (Ap4A) HIT family hydrolase